MFFNPKKMPCSLVDYFNYLRLEYIISPVEVFMYECYDIQMCGVPDSARRRYSVGEGQVFYPACYKGRHCYDIAQRIGDCCAHDMIVHIEAVIEIAAIALQ
jgi:hypothetical protein